MNRDVLRQVILDQRRMYLDMDALIVHREYIFEEGVNDFLAGIRGAGRSTLMYQRIHELLDHGVPAERILYVNFEDERLIEMTASDLNDLLEIGYEMSGGEKPYLFLDEIQNADGWLGFARRTQPASVYTRCTLHRDHKQ